MTTSFLYPTTISISRTARVAQALEDVGKDRFPADFHHRLWHRAGQVAHARPSSGSENDRLGDCFIHRRPISSTNFSIRSVASFKFVHASRETATYVAFAGIAEGAAGNNRYFFAFQQLQGEVFALQAGRRDAWERVKGSLGRMTLEAQSRLIG